MKKAAVEVEAKAINDEMAELNKLIRKCKVSTKPIVLSSLGHSDIAIILPG